MTEADPVVARSALNQLLELGGLDDAAPLARIETQDVALPTRFRVPEGATAALAAGGLAAGRLAELRGAEPAEIRVSSRHAEASLMGFAHLHFADSALGLPPRRVSDAQTTLSGFFPTADNRWVYLHPGFPHNAAGLLALLGVQNDRDAVASAVAARSGQDLEDAVVDARLCSAMVQSPEEWDASGVGRELAGKPVVELLKLNDSPPRPLPRINPQAVNEFRPLDGVDVLDLTRVLAGPACARTLASYGARVLRIGAEKLPSVPLFVVETGFGKRATFLDLNRSADRDRLGSLIGASDVFSQGYRTGAMERHGFGPEAVAVLNPGIVYVSINCYGHEGAWRERPGWEQLAQTVTGIAKLHGEHAHPEGQPMLQPAAVTDYTTGYLAAYGVMLALHRRASEGGSYWVRVSLARTGMWYRSLGLRENLDHAAFAPEEITAMSVRTETHWGPVTHLRPVVESSGWDVNWQLPPVPLGTHCASFTG
ncbi:MAG: CoA transferase [Gammaproteobacteria bacterium]|nr:MAG: CoA transferase [Gammaproteobacteria bacterium]